MSQPTRSLQQLYQDIGPDLLAFFRRRRPSATSPEDLLQDTFFRAMRNPDRLDRAGSPRAYLFGIARHVLLDRVRAHRPMEALTDHPADVSDMGDSRVESMRRAITQLPPVLRETLELKLQSDLSYAELAEILAVPVGTVRSRLHHAVQQLRTHFGVSPKGAS